ncbi:polyamine-modulated factor 1-like [Pelobates fuscus]|uniref:polyamine-modulated factor 1-like n=1 Tax=Pelobates fuscus TaxID=191477 RepID=UPI002FE4E94C
MEVEERNYVVEGASGSSQEPGPSAAGAPQCMLIFDTLVDRFLEGLVEAGSYSRFARCYWRIYKLQPEISRSIYHQFVDQLQKSIKEQIKENAKLSQSVLAGRKRIEQMQKDIERRRQAWQELSKVQRER